jgi:hypothetical protein
MSALLEAIWWSERPGAAGIALAPPLRLAALLFRAGAALRGASRSSSIASRPTAARPATPA